MREISYFSNTGSQVKGEIKSVRKESAEGRGYTLCSCCLSEYYEFRRKPLLVSSWVMFYRETLSDEMPKAYHYPNDTFPVIQILNQTITKSRSLLLRDNHKMHHPWSFNHIDASSSLNKTKYPALTLKRTFTHLNFYLTNWNSYFIVIFISNYHRLKLQFKPQKICMSSNNFNMQVDPTPTDSDEPEKIIAILKNSIKEAEDEAQTLASILASHDIFNMKVSIKEMHFQYYVQSQFLTQEDTAKALKVLQP